MRARRGRWRDQPWFERLALPLHLQCLLRRKFKSDRRYLSRRQIGKKGFKLKVEEGGAPRHIHTGRHNKPTTCTLITYTRFKYTHADVFLPARPFLCCFRVRTARSPQIERVGSVGIITLSVFSYIITSFITQFKCNIMNPIKNKRAYFRFLGKGAIWPFSN